MHKPHISLLTIYDIVALGPRSLHACLTNAGYPCDLILFQDKRDPAGTPPGARDYELLKELLSELKPDVLGISLRSFALKIAERITVLAKEAGVPLVLWGGTHPTLLPEECLERADAVCIGEGEGALLDLAQTLERGTAISSIPNLWLSEYGQVQRNPLRTLIQDLDSLPSPVLGNEGKYIIDQGELAGHDPYLGGLAPVSYFISGSRGCPFQCDFCCNSAFRETFRGLGPYVRKRSPENVIQELELAAQSLEINFVGFMDEVFSLDQQWTKQICALYRERIGIPFKCEIHPGTLTEDLVSAMKEAGLALAVLGVQSGSERSRRENYHRQTSTADILAAADALARHKVLTYYDFIFDNPYESKEDLAQTLDLILHLPRPHNFELFSLAYFPRTKITERALAEGKITPDQVEHRSSKTFADFWTSITHSLNTDNAFYSTLAWLEALKLDWEKLELCFFADIHHRFLHVVPRRVIRGLARSEFLRARPAYIYRLMVNGIKFVNRLLVPLRRTRSAWRLIAAGKWGEVLRLAKTRIARNQAGVKDARG